MISGLSERGDPLRICLVTARFAGKDPVCSEALHCRALASLLAAAGHEVYVLYTGECAAEEGRRCVRLCEAEGICFVPLVDPDRYIEERETIRLVHRVYQWLKIRDFDIVHCVETEAPAFFALLAREQGLAFGSTVFTVLPFAAGIGERKQLGEFFLDSMFRLRMAHMEASVRQKADWLLDTGHGRRPNPDEGGAPAPESIALPLLTPKIESPAAAADDPVDTIVFVSDMDIAGGIEEMIDACRMITDTEEAPASIVFLGGNRGLPTYDCDSRALLSGQLEGLPVSLELDPSLADVVRVLTAPGTLAVLPARHDTALWSARVCLELGVPFAAYATAGHVALVDESSHDELYDPSLGLTALIADRLGRPGRVARPNSEGPDLDAAWLDWHRSLVRRAPQAPAPVSREPLVSVCIATYERPELLARALQSLQRQDYDRLEVVIVDDGSVEDVASRCLADLDGDRLRRNGRVLKIENSGPAAARNHGAARANGDYLMFMDDDNHAFSHEVSTFVSVMQRRGADILTCVQYCWDRHDFERFDPWTCRMILPVGNYPDLALLDCCMGDTNMFLAPRTFFDLGGFPEGDCDEDWDFLISASLAGRRIDVVPEPLYIYRWHVDSNARSGNRHQREMRRVELYKKHAARFPALLELAHGMTRGRSIALERQHVILPLRSRSGLAEEGEGDMEEALLFDEGFYDDEGDFRWACQRAGLNIGQPLKHFSARIGNNVLGRFDRSQTVQVYKNDSLEAELTLDRGEPVLLALHDLEKGDRITFVSDLEFCPRDWGSHDERKLSFMLYPAD